ncbi:sensor histidine kinase [Sinomonas sp. ASV486]|uniref:sensor histidine kinase n=1 Tax=Sinomonas sp. ASV486 TaxID=3051170 RepID=UPI0027DC7AD9|nr:sensor histidine kinase [Sinomonas sp. ASV486]MDQ4491306.1 sensor histidine kinase [Sinomonas sp. ASV486]
MAPALRPPLAHSLDVSLRTVLGLGLVLAGILAALVPWEGPAGWLLLLFPCIFLVYLGAGLLAWYRRPSNRMGPLILVAGMALFLGGGLWNTEVPALVAVGAVCSTLVLASTVHLLHAFPSGRLRGRASRATVVGAYVTALPLQAPHYLFDARGQVPWLLVADSPEALALGVSVQQFAGAAVMVATAVILTRRLLRTERRHRFVLVPVSAYGIFAVIFTPFSSSVLGGLLHLPAMLRGGIQLAVLAGIPVAFALGVLRGGFARTGQLEELGTWLGVSGPKHALSVALSGTLGDPSLELSYWVPQRKSFVDEQGEPVAVVLGTERDTGEGRGTVEVEVDGRRVGAISYDAALIADPELVRTAGRVVAIAVDRERLTAELRSNRAALQRSRERLVNAVDRERRRIAQDLHDGLQMRLVLLALDAQRLGNATGTTEEMSHRATQLRREIDAAAADLRQLVHNVMPAALIEQGLAAAVEDLTDRMPIPTSLEMGPEITPGTRAFPPAVESTAYFVIAEALANTVKHAAAESAAVRVALDDGQLRLEVHDDGVGGARQNDGAGLRGLSDRVEVLAGRLDVTSEPGEGTHITVELPCA